MSEEIRKEIIEIFLICEHHEKLEKAIRKVFGWSQREMAARLLTSQCYISQWERSCLTKEGEEERLYDNLWIELEERIDDMSKIEGITTLINIIDIYKRYTMRLRLGDRDWIYSNLLYLSTLLTKELQRGDIGDLYGYKISF